VRTWGQCPARARAVREVVAVRRARREEGERREGMMV